MNEFIVGLIMYYSGVYNMDPVLSLAVVQVESNFNPNAESPTKDLGLFQLNPESFKHYSREQLLDTETNIKLGVQYLAQMKAECVHREGITWLTCYNYGTQNAKRVKQPNLFPYVRKVRRAMEEFKHGERVIVTGLYDLRLDGEGIYLGLSQEPHYEGYYRIENENGHVMRIHPERVKRCIQ